MRHDFPDLAVLGNFLESFVQNMANSRLHGLPVKSEFLGVESRDL